MDTRNNKHLRYIVFNVYEFLNYYINYGLTLNKKSLYQIYYFFYSNETKSYLNKKNIKLIIENDFKKKFNTNN